MCYSPQGCLVPLPSSASALSCGAGAQHGWDPLCSLLSLCQEGLGNRKLHLTHLASKHEREGHQESHQLPPEAEPAAAGPSAEGSVQPRVTEPRGSVLPPRVPSLLVAWGFSPASRALCPRSLISLHRVSCCTLPWGARCPLGHVGQSTDTSIACPG